MIVTYNNIPIEKIEAIIIDLDDTLYSYDPRHTIGLNAAYHSYTKLFGTSDEQTFNKDYRLGRNQVTTRLSPQGACRSRTLAFQLLLEKNQRNVAYAQVLSETYWDHFISGMKPCESAIEFLKKVKERKIKICILTDMLAAIQMRKIKELGIDSFCDYLVTSEEVGEEKPSPRMFEVALSKLNSSKDRTIMIGDNFKKDIIGAQQFGIKAYQIKAD